MAGINEALRPALDASLETPKDIARRSNPGSEYGITRNARGRSRFWQVNIRRQGRKFCRIFYDGVYGDPETALGEARAYRDTLLAAFAPRVNTQMKRKSTERGMTGVYEIHDRLGRLTCYRASVSMQGELRQKTFSIAKYGPNDARRRAEAQSEIWLAERMLNFMVFNTTAMQQAMQAFPEQLARQMRAAAAGAEEVSTDQRLLEINAEFDARRPQIFTVSVKHTPRGTLILRVTDGGVPVISAHMTTSYRKTSRASALERLKNRAAVYIREFFGRARAERFLQEHAATFTDGNFDMNKGIAIYERP